MALGTKNRQQQTAEVCKQHLRELNPTNLGLVNEFIVEIEGTGKNHDVSNWGRFADAYYEFAAPAATTAADLENFLHDVEGLAKSLGFATAVLNVPFDTPERREFARRLGGAFSLQDDRLRDLALPQEGQIRDYDPVSGACRLIPEHGVVLGLPTHSRTPRLSARSASQSS